MCVLNDSFVISQSRGFPVSALKSLGSSVLNYLICSLFPVPWQTAVSVIELIFPLMWFPITMLNVRFCQQKTPVQQLQEKDSARLGCRTALLMHNKVEFRLHFLFWEEMEVCCQQEYSGQHAQMVCIKSTHNASPVLHVDIPEWKKIHPQFYQQVMFLPSPNGQCNKSCFSVKLSIPDHNCIKMK